MEVIIGWVLLSIGVAALAQSRGRSAGGFFLLSLLMSPLLGLIVVLVLQDLKKKAEQDRQAEHDHERRLEEIKAIAAPRTSTQTPVASQARQSVRGSVADELGKLADLRDRGVLTPEEFQEQKATLLATSQHRPDPRVEATQEATERERQSREAEARLPKGRCPNCSTTMPLSRESCPKCGANFGPGSAWQLAPLER